MLRIFGRGMIFGAGMLVVSLIGSVAWSAYVMHQWRQTTRPVVQDTRPEAVRARIEQEIAAYNADLAQWSTPDITAVGKTLSGDTVITRFMVNRFVAPGERAQHVARLRGRTSREVCGGQVAALRAGLRFVYSYADVWGGEIRFAYGLSECSGG